MSGMDPKRSSVLVHDWEAALNAASGKYNEPRPPPPDYLQWLEDGCPLYVTLNSFLFFSFEVFFFWLSFLPFENNWWAEKFKHTEEIETPFMLTCVIPMSVLHGPFKAYVVRLRPKL